MVKIRLRRVGSKGQASYRIVVADSRSPHKGRFIEIIGFHNPRTEPEKTEIQEDRALYWLGNGAQPTDAVARLLKQNGTLARFERLKQGEPLEALVAEAEEAAQAAPTASLKTRQEPVAAVAEKVEAVEPEIEEEEVPELAEAEAEAEVEVEEEETTEPAEVVSEATTQVEDESEGEEG